MDQPRIGDQVRRRGVLASLFGDEIGTVVGIRHLPACDDEFEVSFGKKRAVVFRHQIVLSKPFTSIKLLRSE